MGWLCSVLCWLPDIQEPKHFIDISCGELAVVIKADIGSRFAVQACLVFSEFCYPHDFRRLLFRWPQDKTTLFGIKRDLIAFTIALVASALVLPEITTS